MTASRPERTSRAPRKAGTSLSTSSATSSPRASERRFRPGRAILGSNMPGPRILLVDGYNVINRLPELKGSLDLGLQNARNQLALRISRWSREHPGVECVIVFDGDIDRAGGREERP